PSSDKFANYNQSGPSQSPRRAVFASGIRLCAERHCCLPRSPLALAGLISARVAFMNAQVTSAMTGLRVIDLTRVLGGPFCTQILADHGADVIKVEPPAGDEVRDWGPPFHEEDAAYFVGINRNKRSIGLDLASEGGRAVLMKMLETADVLIENFKPGTLDKWGIGNEVLRAKFPKLVHCRISGFGADGPRGGNPGYDAIIQAM